MMPVFYGTVVDSAHVGARFVQVTCDRCGFEYFYQLARIGTGSASAPYGIGTGAATNSSRVRSEHDLLQRLALEAELVPCPNCNWINDELVQGYRRGRHRRLGVLAAAVAFIGTFGSLLCAWIIYAGPAVDHGALPYFLFGGPTIFVALALALILLRCWLRSRIQPNRKFPLAPQIPRGTPPALVRNRDNGKLEPARPQDQSVGIHSEWLDFQIGRHQFPSVCCGCLSDAGAEHPFKLLVPRVLTLEIPRCADCERKARRHGRRVGWGTGAVALLAGGGTLWALSLDPVFFWTLFITFAILVLAFAAYAATVAAAPVKVGLGDRSRGIVKLRFRNPEYGQLLAKRMAQDFSESAKT